MIYGDRGSLLFHYTTADIAFAHILSSGSHDSSSGLIRLSAYRLMNDPLEAKAWPLMPAYFIPEGQDAAMERAALEHLDYAALAKQRAKLLSLTQDAETYAGRFDGFSRGYARASLWEHYGDRHAGVCLAFDRAALSAALLEQLASHGAAYAEAVRYSEDGYTEDPGARTLVLDSGRVEDVANTVDHHIATHRRSLLFTKLADWSNENEYRFVVVGGDDNYVYCDYRDSLRAVFIGERFPDWQVEAARYACRTAGVDLVRMKWELGRPMALTQPLS